MVPIWDCSRDALLFRTFLGMCSLSSLINSFQDCSDYLLHHSPSSVQHRLGFCSNIKHVSNSSALSFKKVSVSNSRRRDFLVGYRTAATYASNFLVLFISLFIFIMTDDCHNGFRILDGSVTGLGLLCSLVYLIAVPEVKYSRLARYHHSLSKNASSIPP